MRVCLVAVLVVALAADGERLSAQEAPALTGPPADSVGMEAQPAPWRYGVVLPAALAVEPPQTEAPALRAEDKTVPFFSGLFGAIAGMFVANWWVQRNCEERCAEEKLYMLFIGGGIGAMVGWLAGGGEVPDTPPPFLRRQPP